MQLYKCEDILKKYPVKFAYLFGSYNKGTYTPLSDIDLAIYWEIPEVELEIFLKLKNEIEEKCDCELSVNIVDLSQVPLPIKAEIINTGKLIFEKNRESRIEFEVKTRMEYLDFLPAYEKLVKTYLNNVKTEGIL